MAEYATILLEKKGRIAKVTLNRPAALNAINQRMIGELAAVVDALERDGECDVVILTGAGRAFCAGRDIKEMGQSLDQTNLLMATGDRIRLLDKPTIAAVNGYAVTGGFELALCCDIIIAAEEARFADTHARLGLVPGLGLSQLLPRLVGTKKAKEMSFTGNYMTAREALQFGLVNRVVPAGELEAAVEALANDILSCDRAIVRKMKKLIDGGQGMGIEQAFMLERYEQMLHKQGLTAADVERRRKGVMERGRAQAAKEQGGRK